MLSLSLLLECENARKHVDTHDLIRGQCQCRDAAPMAESQQDHTDSSDNSD